MLPARYPIRVGLIFSIVFFVLLLWGGLLVLMQVFRSSYLAQKARQQHERVVELPPKRGTIYDRNGRVLAHDVVSYSLFADAKGMDQQAKSHAVSLLPKMTGLSGEEIRSRLSKNKNFVWLARKLTTQKMQEIKALKIKGVDFIKESKRVYPQGSLAAHVLGFVDIDNHGLQGVEHHFDAQLKGRSGMARFLRDARQDLLLMEDSVVEPVNGNDITLTIDETIQFLAEKGLDESIEKFHAKAGTVIVMDPKTGEILAFANRPTFSPEDPQHSAVESRTNRAVVFVFEPGSVFKIVTAAAALEEGRVTEEEVFFCENGKYRVSNHTLKDAHPYGSLSFRDVFAKSSNIGMVKLAQRLGPDKVYEYGHRFRFGMPTGIGMAGEVPGWFKHPRQWSKTSIGAIPIGQEVTVTPIQLVCALAAVANDGAYMRPYYVSQVRDPQGVIIEERGAQKVSDVITPATATRLKALMREVVETGTAQIVKIKDISVGGKTGTAQKVENGTYSHSKFVSSFMGIAPIDEPMMAIVVSIDEPRPQYYGGTVAGPVFKKIVENGVPYLQSKRSQADERANPQGRH